MMQPRDKKCEQTDRNGRLYYPICNNYRPGTDRMDRRTSTSGAHTADTEYSFLCRWNEQIEQCECYNKPYPQDVIMGCKNGECPSFPAVSTPLTDKVCRKQAGLTDEDVEWDCRVNPNRYRECQCGPMSGFDMPAAEPLAETTPFPEYEVTEAPEVQ